MKKKVMSGQRVLQIGFGLGILVLVFLIDMVAVHPSGIYSYVQTGVKPFRIGQTKTRVLEMINETKSIRKLLTCSPDTVLELRSRKGFEMGPILLTADIWIANARNGRHFLFVFQENSLKRILFQRLRFAEKKGSDLFERCRQGVETDLDAVLAKDKTLAVFYDDRSDRESKK